MHLDYVPLLPIQRELQSIPRGQPPHFNGLRRFKQYLRTIATADGKIALPPLVAANPMAKDHVTALLDALLALDADGVASRAAAAAAAELADVPGEYKATVVVIDDAVGAWSNRVSFEYDFRFRTGPVTPEQLPRWADHAWVFGVLWSSEPASERAVREAMLTAVYRLAYIHRHGPAVTLREKIAQEGWVLNAAGCAGPPLDADDLAYTREVLTPYLDATDMRTCCECLFGDAAAKSLGFTPRGLSPWAGVAVGVADAWETSMQNKAKKRA
jgi:hypothetical protein